MTPDQKLFVLEFVKQLHTCIEKHGTTSGAQHSVQEEQGAYSCGSGGRQSQQNSIKPRASSSRRRRL